MFRWQHIRTQQLSPSSGISIIWMVMEKSSSGYFLPFLSWSSCWLLKTSRLFSQRDEVMMQRYWLLLFFLSFKLSLWRSYPLQDSQKAKKRVLSEHSGMLSGLENQGEWAYEESWAYFWSLLYCLWICQLWGMRPLRSETKPGSTLGVKSSSWYIRFALLTVTETLEFYKKNLIIQLYFLFSLDKDYDKTSYWNMK